MTCSEQRIAQFQFCIDRVAQALGACCGGVDSSPADQMADPYSTTRVLCDSIEKLKSRADSAANWCRAESASFRLHELYVAWLAGDIDAFNLEAARIFQKMHDAKCVCGNSSTLGVVHRADGPCFIYNNIAAPIGLQDKGMTEKVVRQQWFGDRNGTFQEMPVVYMEPSITWPPAAPPDVTQAMVGRFLTWPLPESVCADMCATSQGWSGRTGTNLLTATEAKQMLEHVLSRNSRVITDKTTGDQQ